MPFSLVDSRELLQEMDNKYQVPHRKGVSVEFSKIYNHLHETIRLLLIKAVVISICADIWSKPGMTLSFLDVTAHFFTPESNKRHSIYPHTGVRIAEILQRIVAEWKYHVINCSVFTDNGSNVVSAFKANNEDDIAEFDGDKSDTNSVTPEESEELFPDQ